jgi:hypothetical protein
MQSSTYFKVLLACWLLFVVRVVVQWLQWVIGFDFFPHFDAWHSGALPYPWLLSSQILIIAVMAWAMWCIKHECLSAQRRWGLVWTGLGWVYFAVMVVRLVLSFTWAAKGSWWHAPIPSFFHLVLATFVITIGRYHLTLAGRANETEQSNS